MMAFGQDSVVSWCSAHGKSESLRQKVWIWGDLGSCENKCSSTEQISCL